MATTIGRAGKQLFAAIDPTRPPSLSTTAGDAPVRDGAVTSPRPATPPSDQLLRSVSSVRGKPLTSSASKMLSLSVIQSDRRVSQGTADLEKTLKEYADLQVPQFLVVDSPSKPIALSPRLDKDLLLNTQSRGQFDEWSTAVGGLLSARSRGSMNSAPTATIANAFNAAPATAVAAPSSSTSSAAGAVAAARQRSSSTSAEEFLSALHKTLENKRSFNKDELLAQLEVLKTQNLVLALSLERKDRESQEKLDKEKEEREKALRSLESANRALVDELLDARRVAEERLAEETTHFEQSMHTLQSERERLTAQIAERERQRDDEQAAMNSLRSELAKRIDLLEIDRQRMLRELQQALQPAENALHSERESESGIGSACDVRALQAQLENMDREKSALTCELQARQETAQRAHDELAKELSLDRARFAEHARRIEREKHALADRLLAAENVAKIQQQVVSEELDKQQRRREREEEREIERDAPIKKTVSFSDKELVLGFGAAPPSDSEENEERESGRETETERDAQEEGETEGEGEGSLRDKLRRSAAQSRRRVEELTARLKRRNKDRLRKNVLRMRDSMQHDERERDKEREGDTERGTEREGENKSLYRSLPSTQSLFALSRKNSQYQCSKRSSNAPSAAASPSAAQSLPQDREEEDNYEILGQENVLDELDGLHDTTREDDGKRPENGRKEESFTTTTTPLRRQRETYTESETETETESESLPPAHLAASRGDVSHLSLLHSLDPRLVLFAADAANRQPLFYAAAHAQRTAVELLLSLLRADETTRCENTNNHLRDRCAAAVSPTQAVLAICDKFNSLPSSLALSHTQHCDTHCDTNTQQSDDTHNPLTQSHTHSLSPLTTLSPRALSKLHHTIDSAVYSAVYGSALYAAVSRMDVFGDTPVHAAAAAGDAALLSLLLHAVSQFVLNTIQRVFKEFLEKIREQQCGGERESGREGDTQREAHSDTHRDALRDTERDTQRDRERDPSTATEDDIETYSHTERIHTTILSFLVNAQNALGLTPAHLTPRGAALEALHAHHANLLAADFQGRSVLFVACAMNHADAVEFLVNALDNLPEVLMSRCLLGDEESEGEGEGKEENDREKEQKKEREREREGEGEGERGKNETTQPRSTEFSKQKLKTENPYPTDVSYLTEQYVDDTDRVITEQILKRDFRGDTPLHAAACNNALESLLVLLQSGIDPRLLNDKQFTAYDLAVKHKYSQCAAVLAEYTLHYCTSSEFDSVLFLKTLEGQKKIAELAKNLPAYYPGAARPSKTNTLSAKHKSMFSLNSARSMKLQRYGHWIAYYDADNPFAVFWYNHETTEGQWETPLEVMEWQERHSSSSIDIFDKTMKGKMSMRLRREGDWILYTAEEGKTFYYNDKTGEFQWTSPFADDAAAAAAPFNKHSLKGFSVKQRRSGASAGEGEDEDEEYYENNNAAASQKSELFANYQKNDFAAYTAQWAALRGGNSQGVSTKQAKQQEQVQVQQESGGASDQEQNLPLYVRTTPWRPYTDESTQAVYWYNHDTQCSQWESPFDTQSARVTATGVTTSVSAKSPGESLFDSACASFAAAPVVAAPKKSVFDDDDDEDDEEIQRETVKKKDSSAPPRRSELKDQLREFHLRNSQRRLRKTKTEDYDEPVVSVHNENDLDL